MFIIVVDLGGIEPPAVQCECTVLPLDYRPEKYHNKAIVSQNERKGKTPFKSFPPLLLPSQARHPPRRRGTWYGTSCPQEKAAASRYRPATSCRMEYRKTRTTLAASLRFPPVRRPRHRPGTHAPRGFFRARRRIRTRGCRLSPFRRSQYRTPLLFPVWPPPRSFLPLPPCPRSRSSVPPRSRASSSREALCRLSPPGRGSGAFA